MASIALRPAIFDLPVDDATWHDDDNRGTIMGVVAIFMRCAFDLFKKRND
jgi:hypothetical protein